MNNNHTPKNIPMFVSFGDSSLTLVDTDGTPTTISNDQINYKTVYDAVLTSDWATVRDNLDEPKAIINATHGNVSIENNKSKYHGEELHNSVAKKLTDLIAQGMTDVDRWLKFINKLMANPSYNSREQAYNFIAHQGMPLTEDGNIIGYKGVRDDYMDKYSGTFDNSVGKEHWMQRADVDATPNNGCSSGFHIGSHEYADSWASSDAKLMLVEYSPADIVSVPDEHLHGKLRVCRYKVIDECHTRRPVQDGAYGENTDQDCNKQLIDFLEQQCDEWGYTSYAEIQHEFPWATMDDVLSLCREHLNASNPLSWNSTSNDWDISLN